MTEKTFNGVQGTETASYSAPKLTRYGDMIEMTAGSSNKTMDEGMFEFAMRNKV